LLISIEVTYTKTGRKQFNLSPPDPRKGEEGVVRHKDRYSALLLANYVVSRFGKLTYDEKQSVRKVYEESMMHTGWLDDLAQDYLDQY